MESSRERARGFLINAIKRASTRTSNERGHRKFQRAKDSLNDNPARCYLPGSRERAPPLTENDTENIKEYATKYRVMKKGRRSTQRRDRRDCLNCSKSFPQLFIIRIPYPNSDQARLPFPLVTIIAIVSFIP